MMVNVSSCEHCKDLTDLPRLRAELELQDFRQWQVEPCKSMEPPIDYEDMDDWSGSWEGGSGDGGDWASSSYEDLGSRDYPPTDSLGRHTGPPPAPSRKPGGRSRGPRRK